SALRTWGNQHAKNPEEQATHRSAEQYARSDAVCELAQDVFNVVNVLAGERILRRHKYIAGSREDRKDYGQDDQYLAKRYQQHARDYDVWIAPEFSRVYHDSGQHNRQSISARDGEVPRKRWTERPQDQTDQPNYDYEPKQRRQQSDVIPQCVAANSHDPSLAISGGPHDQ